MMQTSDSHAISVAVCSAIVFNGLAASGAPPSRIRSMMRNIAGLAAVSARAAATTPNRGASVITRIATAQAPMQKCVPKDGRIDHGSPGIGIGGVASE